jgi:transcriptional regulator with XRE-family HTH domain
MTLGQRLRDLRAEKKITQQELSDTVKIPRSTIGMYEADHRKPRFDELDTLADYFDTSLDYILGRSDVNHGYPRHVVIETKQDLIGSAEKRMRAYFKGTTELMHLQILQAYDAADPGIQMAVRKLLGVDDGDR